MTGLLTAPFWKSLNERDESCARMCWQERIASLTILSGEPLFPHRSRGSKEVWPRRFTDALLRRLKTWALQQHYGMDKAPSRAPC